MLCAEFEIRRRPPEQCSTFLAIWLAELAPSSKALLVPVGITSWQIGCMAVFRVMRVATDDGTAPNVLLLVVARTPPQEAFWVFWVHGLRDGRAGGLCWCRRWKGRPRAVFDLDGSMVLHGRGHAGLVGMSGQQGLCVRDVRKSTGRLCYMRVALPAAVTQSSGRVCCTRVFQGSHLFAPQLPEWLVPAYNGGLLQIGPKGEQTGFRGTNI